MPNLVLTLAFFYSPPSHSTPYFCPLPPTSALYPLFLPSNLTKPIHLYVRPLSSSNICFLYSKLDQLLLLLPALIF